MSIKEDRATVESPRYSGVSVDHPAIVDAIKTMAKEGKKLQEIMRVVGMPAEVIRRHAPEVQQK